MDYQLGIALTGGGARGVAHLGLLKALEEEGIKPDVISGASAGALVGALYAGGFSLAESLDFFKTTPVFSFNYFSFYKPGFLEIIKYRKFFEKYFSYLDKEIAMKKQKNEPLKPLFSVLGTMSHHYDFKS